MRYSIARRYRLAAFAAGLLVAGACFTMLAALAAYDQLRKMDEVQAVARATIQSIALDTRNVLQRLNRNYPPVCSEENLRRLREEMFLSTHQADIGVLDRDHRLRCTAVMGLLARPMAVPAPDVVIRSEVGDDQFLSFGIPLLVWDGRYRAMVVRSGNFNTVVDPHELEELFAKDDGTVRIRQPEGNTYVVHADPNLAPELARRLGGADLLASPVHHFSWSDLAFISSRGVAGTPYVTQYVTPLSQFLTDQGFRLGLALVFSLVSGVLTYGALVPVFRRWRGLQYRIAGLLTDDNIVCTYQPIVDMRTGIPVGCEVLMRLRDGAEILYPEVVLPAVIERDLCWELDRVVVSRAVRELFRHLPARHDLGISFNFFPKNIDAARVRALIEGELKRAGHAGFRFDIEVIEQDYQSTLLVQIADLKRSGYLVSVDDFGTGYSNLASVRALAPDFLKIDKSFVFEMEDASVRSSLIPEIVAIARAVGAQVIAEGIENEAQRRKLLEFGVDYGQGFLFARPMEIDALVRYLEATPGRAA